jgi:hypothetical protein
VLEVAVVVAGELVLPAWVGGLVSGLVLHGTSRSSAVIVVTPEVDRGLPNTWIYVDDILDVPLPCLVVV